MQFFCTNEQVKELFLNTGRDDNLLTKIIEKQIHHSILSGVSRVFNFCQSLEDISRELIVQILFSVLLAKFTVVFCCSHFEVLLLGCKDVATRWSLQRTRNLEII